MCGATMSDDTIVQFPTPPGGVAFQPISGAADMSPAEVVLREALSGQLVDVIVVGREPTTGNMVLLASVLNRDQVAGQLLRAANFALDG